MRNPNSNLKLVLGERTEMVLRQSLKPTEEKLLDICAELKMLATRFRVLEQWELFDQINDRIVELRIRAVEMRMKKRR